MTIKELLIRARMSPQISDPAAVKISDYQMMTALNGVLEMVYATIGSTSTSILDKEKEIKLKDGKGALPSDFMSLKEVVVGAKELTPARRSDRITADNYRIRAKSIYSANDTVTLIYMPCFTELSHDDIEDDLPLPDFFNGLLLKYLIVFLVGGVPAADAQTISAITADVYHIVANREWSLIQNDANTASWRV